jgi:hypothetical protein
MTLCGFAHLEPLPSPRTGRTLALLAHIHAHNLPRGDGLGPMGHEELGLFRPIVAPTWAQHHGDIAQMAPPRPLGIDPTGASALGVHGRHAHLGLLPAGPMGAAGFVRLANFQVRGRAITYQ